MKPQHILLVLSIILIWGLTFIVIEYGIETVSPTFLCFLRFLFAGFPAVFFVKKPKNPIWKIFLYALFSFVGQIVFLSVGISQGVSAGIASVCIQTQVFITIILASIFMGEKSNVFQIIGAIISFFGVGIIAFHTGGEVTLSGLAFILMGALSWGVGNIIAKSFVDGDGLSIVVWGSALASFPLMIVTLCVNGWSGFLHDISSINLSSVISLTYLVVLTTLLGYSIWNKLLSHYLTSQVAPFTLIIPIVALTSSVIFFNEPLEIWKIIAFIFVLLGLLVNIVSSKLIRLVMHYKKIILHCSF